MDETKLDNGSAAANEGMDKAAGTSVFINSKKENIFKPIQAVSGVVQRKQPLPVLSNILFVQKGKQVTLVANDLDLQILTVAEIGEENSEMSTTISARKLTDILATLPTPIRFLSPRKGIT